MNAAIARLVLVKVFRQFRTRDRAKQMPYNPLVLIAVALRLYLYSFKYRTFPGIMSKVGKTLSLSRQKL